MAEYDVIDVTGTNARNGRRMSFRLWRMREYGSKYLETPTPGAPSRVYRLSYSTLYVVGKWDGYDFQDSTRQLRYLYGCEVVDRSVSRGEVVKSFREERERVRETTVEKVAEAIKKIVDDPPPTEYAELAKLVTISNAMECVCEEVSIGHQGMVVAELLGVDRESARRFVVDVRNELLKGGGKK